MATIWYCTREDVKHALDSKETARDNRKVDRAIEASSRGIEGELHRTFRPVVATRYFDWPPEGGYGRSWRLWLDADQLISVTAMSSGGAAIPAGTGYLLEPANSGPPYTHVEVNLSGPSAFGGGDTHQRDVTITGLWGFRNDEAPAGALAEALDAGETAVDVTDSAAIGVGDILRVDSERMAVTGKAMLDTGQNVGGNLTATTSDVTVPVTTGSAYALDEVLLVDAERMLVVDIAGNNLIVKRAWDGSVLAAHSNGADIYAPRTLTVERGALGTTAAGHDTAAAVARHLVPGLIRDLCIAESIAQLQQEGSGYGRTVGSGESEREARGVGLVDIRKRAYTAYGRKARIRAV